MPILRNIGILYTCEETGGQGELHPLEAAAIVWKNGVIEWVGREADVPAVFKHESALDAGGMLVAPGLVDCHTHLAFGGWRGEEFALRALGKGYLEIAKAGGGIASTMRQTRESSEDQLVEKTLPLLDEMLVLGITTVECKSGYGLTLSDELKLLQVYRRLSGLRPARLIPTLLAAHIVPPEFSANREGYMRMIVDELLPAVADENLAFFFDVFVEETAFSHVEAERLFEAAKRYGLRPKLHVDQLSDGGGAGLAARVGAVSADHLEFASPAGIRAMANAGVTAVSLPFATFNLRQPPMPARAFIEAGVPVAVATDFNPGSAPSYHLPAAMYMACILQHMSPAETLKGATLYAARALGLEDTIGSLVPGKRADFVLIEAEDVNQWISHLRPNAVRCTFVSGRRVAGEV